MSVFFITKIIALSVTCFFFFQLLMRVRSSVIARYFSLIYLGVISHLAYAGNAELTNSTFLNAILLFPSLCVPLMIWLLSRAIFDDHFKVTPSTWWICALYAAVVVSTYLAFRMAPTSYHEQSFFYLLEALHFLAKIAALLATFYVVIKDYRYDLLIRRMRLRLLLVTLMTGYVGLVVGFETFFYGMFQRVDFASLNHIIITMLTFLFSYSLAQQRTSFDLFWISPNEENKNTAGGESRQSRQSEKLKTLMESDQAFRINGLTVGQLASMLDMKEHQLRVLINREMGYKNFRDFLNGYRLVYVKQQLKDTDLPIITIALEAGFSSLSTFNRTFREIMKMTPTEYRDLPLETMKN